MKITIDDWTVTVNICKDDDNLTLNIQKTIRNDCIIGRTFEAKMEGGTIVIMDWNKLDDGMTEKEAELS